MTSVLPPPLWLTSHVFTTQGVFCVRVDSNASSLLSVSLAAEAKDQTAGSTSMVGVHG